MTTPELKWLIFKGERRGDDVEELIEELENRKQRDKELLLKTN